MSSTVSSTAGFIALQRKRVHKNIVAPAYGIAIEDEDIPDYALDDLFDEEEVQPEQNKQLMIRPPTYEESLPDVLEGKKQVYIDPRYLPPEPPEYD